MNKLGILDKPDTKQDTIEINIMIHATSHNYTFYPQKEVTIIVPTHHTSITIPSYEPYIECNLTFEITFSFDKKKNVKSITLTMNYCTNNLEEQRANARK